MNHQLPQISLPPKGEVLPGFRLGSRYAAHAEGFAGLERLGFSAPTEWTDLPQQVIVVNGPQEVADGANTALAFEYEGDVLRGIKIVLADAVGEDAAEPQATARRMIETLKSLLGNPNIALDRVEAWADHPGVHTSMPAVAAGLFWSGSLPPATHTTAAKDTSQFLDAVEALKHGGALALLTGLQGGVIAEVDFFETPRPAGGSNSLLSALSR